MRRALHTSSLCVVALMLGCSAQYPDGRFACDATHACPPGLTCSAGLCYHQATDAAADAATDGGTPIDVGGVDAPSADGGSSCTSANGCITINLTNAFPLTPTGTTMATIGGMMIPLPAYGQTMGPYTIPLDAGGAMVTVTLAPGAPTVMLPATRDHTYVLAGNGTSVATLSASLYDLDPASLPPATAGTISAVFIDFFSDNGDLLLTRNLTMDTQWPSSRSTHSRAVTLMAGDTLLVSRANQLDTVVLAGFSTHDFPAAGAFYVILAGEPGHHLAAADGIRAIPAVVGQMAHPSRELFTLANFTNAALELCHGTMSIDTVNGGSITNLLHGFDANGGLTLDVVLESDGCMSGSANRYTAMLASPRPGRLLVVAAGDTGNHTTWNVGTMLEPAPDPTVRQTIVFLDTAPEDISVTGVTGTTSAFGAVTVPRDMFAVARASTVPSRIDVTFATGPQPVSFDMWQAVGSVAWAVLMGGTGSVSQLYSIDAPYGHGWSNEGYVDSTISACVPYCNAMQMNCTGANAQYVDTGTCLASCNAFGWAPGSLGQTMNDTLACRTTHAMSAATTPATECPIAGPLGGGMCGMRCGAFCGAVTATCSGMEPYAMMSDCVTACTTWADHLTANGPVMLMANTLGCRTSVLEMAAGDTTNCPDLAVMSNACR